MAQSDFQSVGQFERLDGKAGNRRRSSRGNAAAVSGQQTNEINNDHTVPGMWLQRHGDGLPFLKLLVMPDQGLPRAPRHRRQVPVQTFPVWAVLVCGHHGWPQGSYVEDTRGVQPAAAPDAAKRDSCLPLWPLGQQGWVKIGPVKTGFAGCSIFTKKSFDKQPLLTYLFNSNDEWFVAEI